MGIFKRRNVDGVEEGTWYVDYRDPTGKRIIKAIGPKQKDAEAYLGGIKHAIREGRFFDMKKENTTTFNELLDAYIEFRSKTEKGKKYFDTSIKYFTGDNEKEDPVEGVLREYFKKRGINMLSEINLKVLEEFRDERKATPTQYKTPRSERTVNLEMAILRHIFKKGVKWGMMEKNPFENNEEDLFYEGQNKRERALTEDEVKRLIDACPSRLKPIVLTAVYTGLRKGDVLGLKWTDIRFKIVKDQHGKESEIGLIQLSEQKTGKTRNIVLNDDMITRLHKLPVKGEYVFPDKDGKPYGDVKKSFQTALKNPGIKQCEDRKHKIVFHTLRHTCISLLTEKGADTTMVKNYVAHVSEEMTEQYTHLSESMRGRQRIH